MTYFILSVIISITTLSFAQKVFAQNDAIYIVSTSMTGEFNDHFKSFSQLKVDLANEAQKGKVIFAEEGKIFEKNQSHSYYGLEDADVCAFCNALTLYNTIAFYKSIKNYILLIDALPSNFALKKLFTYLNEDQFLRVPKTIIDSSTFSIIQSMTKQNEWSYIYGRHKSIIDTIVKNIKSDVETTYEEENPTFLKVHSENPNIIISEEDYSFKNPSFAKVYTDLDQGAAFLKDVLEGLIPILIGKAQLPRDILENVHLIMEEIQKYIDCEQEVSIPMLLKILKNDSIVRNILTEVILEIRTPTYIKSITTIVKKNRLEKKSFYVTISPLYEQLLLRQLEKMNYKVILLPYTKINQFDMEQKAEL